MDDRVKVVILKQSTIPLIGNIISRLRLRRFLLRQRFNAVEVPDFMGMLPFHVPHCVVRLHLSSTAISDQRGEKVSWGVWIYESMTLRMNRHWIAVSQHILDLTAETFGITPTHAKVVHNPLPGEEHSTSESLELPERFILFAGQVSERKGAIVLAEAFRKIVPE
jgi:glycosyltransferase involved in cell wall biosynthesis